MNKKNVLYVKNLNKIYSKNSSNSIQAINDNSVPCISKVNECGTTT